MDNKIHYQFKKKSSKLPSLIVFITALLFFAIFFTIKLLIPTHLNFHFMNENSFLDSVNIIPKIFPGNSVYVRTESGDLRGFKFSVDGCNISTFLGVPYAKPPINKLRFRRPEPIEKWKGTLDATRFSPQCIQYKPNRTYTPWISTDDNVSEDCLYLNIWNPETKNPDKLKSVMVWIHGGAYFSGSSDLHTYDGRYLACYGDVIVVSINYRLASLGFLNLEIDEAPGNQGLLDQVLALQWIQKNIKYFGGDAKEVTLFGQSAGAISVGLHHLSPLSKHLFKRGIMQSGSPAVTRLFYEREDELATRGVTLAQMLGCHTLKNKVMIDAEKVIDCMRKAKLEDIQTAQAKLIEDMSLSFGPTIDNEFLPDHALSLIQGGHFGDQKEIMIGISRDEGSFFLHYMAPSIFSYESKNLTFQESMKIVRKSFNFLPDRIANIIFRTFLPLDEDSKSDFIRQTLADFIGDSTFTCPSVLFAKIADSFDKNIYFYRFDHKASNSPWPAWMGVLHFEEIQFIFGVPLRYSHLYDEREIEFSKRLIDTWTTFAKTGQPCNQYNLKWPQYKITMPRYMRLIAGNASVEYGPREETCNKWSFILENS